MQKKKKNNIKFIFKLYALYHVRYSKIQFSKYLFLQLVSVKFHVSHIRLFQIILESRKYVISGIDIFR